MNVWNALAVVLVIVIMISTATLATIVVAEHRTGKVIEHNKREISLTERLTKEANAVLNKIYQ